MYQGDVFTLFILLISFQLRSLYGKDPHSLENLQPTYPEPPPSDLVQQLINFSIDPQSVRQSSEDAEVHALNTRRVQQFYKRSEYRDGMPIVESNGEEGQDIGDTNLASSAIDGSGIDIQVLRSDNRATEKILPNLVKAEVDLLGPCRFWYEAMVLYIDSD